eukprot:scaffold3537_cov256-Pinguiococcus_pyrenoidosus.AAC.2
MACNWSSRNRFISTPPLLPKRAVAISRRCGGWRREGRGAPENETRRSRWASFFGRTWSVGKSPGVRGCFLPGMQYGSAPWQI